MGSFITTFIVLSIVGAIDSAYLLWKHQQHQPLICPLDHDCSAVTESKWSRILLVRNEVLGTAFYVTLLLMVLATLLKPEVQLLPKLIPWITGTGLVFSLFLVYIQIYKIKDYCFYCLASAFITVLLFLNSFVL